MRNRPTASHQEQHQGSIRIREDAEEAAKDAIETVLRLGWTEDRYGRLHTKNGFEIRKQVQHNLSARTQCLEKLLAPTQNVLIGFREKLARQFVECFADRGIRRSAHELIELS